MNKIQQSGIKRYPHKKQGVSFGKSVRQLYAIWSKSNPNLIISMMLNQVWDSIIDSPNSEDAADLIISHILPNLQSLEIAIDPQMLISDLEEWDSESNTIQRRWCDELYSPTK